MALSKFRNALESSLTSSAERKFIAQFYHPQYSYTDFLKYYGRAINKLSDDIDNTPLGDRPYQRDNITHRLQKLKGGEPINGFVTRLPAGAGKTRIFVETLMRTAKEVKIGGETKLVTPPAVILVPTVDLLEQTYDRLKKDHPNLVVGKRYGKVPRAQKDDIQPLTIYIYDTFMNDAHSGWIHPGDVKLAVLDEAHRCLSETRFDKMKDWKGLTFFDAYSASPTPDNERDLYKLLGESSQLPGPTDHELTDQGYLAPCHNIISKIVINKDDVPHEIRDNSEKYGDFLQQLKTQAALEIYKNYRDPETGQRPLGKPTIGYTRYVRDAQEAGRIFEKELRNMADDDTSVRKLLAPYSHLTQVLSRDLLGDKGVDQAFDRVLPHDRIKNPTSPQERALITLTRNMASEGFDAPELKTAIRFQTGENRWEGIQRPGRARRPITRTKPKGKPQQEVSFVIDCIIEEDGKIIGNPMPYYKAIDDPSILRGVQTFTPPPEQIDAIANEVLEYKDRKEMQDLVLGNGIIAAEKAKAFEGLWSDIEQHAYQQSKQPHPKPYVLDGEEIRAKIVTASSEDNGGAKRKTEFRVSKAAIDQFRHALDIPGQTGVHWLTEEKLEREVIGTGMRADHYRAAFKRALVPALAQFRKSPHQPYILNNKSISLQTRMDINGDPITAFHHSAVQAFRERLDVLPAKTRRFMDFEEFSEAVFDQVESHEPYLQRLGELWEAAKRHYASAHKPGQHTRFAIGSTKAEIAECLGKNGKKTFCIERKGVHATREHFGIPAMGFDVDGIEWTTDPDEIVKIRGEINKALGGVPTTEDGREYVEGPHSINERPRFIRFKKLLAANFTDKGYPLPNLPSIPRDKTVIEYKNSNYYHPDVYADLKKRDLQKGISETLPKTDDGRPYILGPDAIEERAKYKRFNRRIAAVLTEEGYPLSGKEPIPQEKITILFKGRNYTHPDVYADLEKMDAIPKTDDGRLYVKGPNVLQEGAKNTRFGRLIASNLTKDGYPLPDHAPIPQDKIIITYQGSNYYHPDVYADLEEKVAMPMTEDGRSYVEGPNNSTDQAKYMRFKYRLASKVTTNGYPLVGQKPIHPDKIIIKYKGRNYYHPDVYADLEKGEAPSTSTASPLPQKLNLPTHWLSDTQLLTALDLPATAKNLGKIRGVCKQLLSTDAEMHVAAGYGKRAGEYPAAKLIKEDQGVIYADPRIATDVCMEMGESLPLPSERKYCLDEPAMLERLEVKPSKAVVEKLHARCDELIGMGGEYKLPPKYGQPGGKIDMCELLNQYRKDGKVGYFADPRLLDAGVISAAHVQHTPTKADPHKYKTGPIAPKALKPADGHDLKRKGRVRDE